MAYNVTSLPEYVNQRKDVLLTKAALGAETLGVIDVMLNVKHKEALSYLEVEAPFQDAASCGFTPEGSDTITNRTIEVKPIKVNKEYCPKDLLPKWLNQDLKIAAGLESMPFEEVFMDENNKAINAGVEDIIWKGDNGLGIDGFVTLAGSEPDVITDSLASTATASDLVDAVYAAIPVAVMKRNPVIFLSHTMFRAYVGEQNASCCANRPMMDAASGEIKYPGDSRVTIKPVAGLEGTKFAFGGDAKNFTFGTDVENSQNIYKLWYSEDNDTFRYKVEFTAGVQFKLPSEIVAIDIQ